MSVSLSYSTADRGNPAVRTAILSAAEEINAQRDWWCEGINFFDSPVDGQLYGSTKLFLTGYSTDDGQYVEVAPEDDAFMAWRDAHLILEQLAAWSTQHSIEWALESDGLPMGHIKKGALPKEALDTLNMLRSTFSASPEMVEAERYARRISSQYATRNA